MTSANRKDGTRLLLEYLETPTLELRDEIFKIMDPYMQRYAQRIAEKGYYYDDVLQNIRLNLFELLDTESSKKARYDSLTEQINKSRKQNRWELVAIRDRIPAVLDTMKKLKTKLFHFTDNTIDAKIPQTDENIVSWNRLNHIEQEKLIPSNTVYKQDMKEAVDVFMTESKLTPYEKKILDMWGITDRDLEDIAQMFNLSRERVRQIKEKALKRVRKQFGLDKKPDEKPQIKEVWKIKGMELDIPDDFVYTGNTDFDPEYYRVWLDCDHFVKTNK